MRDSCVDNELPLCMSVVAKGNERRSGVAIDNATRR
jgi:hypothetical protein